MSLSVYRVATDVDEVFYIPEFVNEDEEQYLLRKITESSSVKWKALANRRLQIWGGELTPSNVLIRQPFPEFVAKFPDLIGRIRDTGAFASSKHGEPNHIIVNEYHPSQGIMPHEDGPSYHPVVATLSLGSHTVFNYHRHEETTDTSPSKAGRVIDPKPMISLLLEPRSLVITAKSLYTDHLHAIEPLRWDVLAPGDPTAAVDAAACEEGETPPRVRVANWEMVRGERAGRVAREGGELEREMRVSLTCRDVERVFGGYGQGLGRVFGER